MASFELDQFLLEDGNINYGQVMRYWRKQVLHWKNAQTLADVYNEVASEDDPVTGRTIQRMEQQNNVPIDPKRRWLLATILNIPPAYLGLSALRPETFSDPEMRMTSLTQEKIDSSAYSDRLLQLWKHWSAYPAREILEELLMKISLLQEQVLYGNQQQRNQFSFLLCHYLVLYGNIRRDQGYSESAISFLQKALSLAQEKGYAELGAKAAYLKGYAEFDLWGLQSNRSEQRSYLQAARSSFQLALHLVDEAHKKKALNKPLQSAIIAELGLVQAYFAQSATEKTQALQTIDKTATIISSADFQRDPTFLHINDEWYHIDKAEAYVALHCGQDAVHELMNVDRSNPHTRRRYIYTDIVEADAYLLNNQLEMAISCAEQALELIVETPSFIFITRLANMYHSLRATSSYARSPDLARLGGKLLKIQHADLFAE
ncbi:hypothetical protein [Tengunoibacter tsumagoiensis]|uniref:HTH cro/C1-type domain-containing protein n=1 Tax=Tengunoibacter tsumagoiensis TaxID=2014871 RepID=A0A402AA26_9CHLR|nr:hypothetical protein [Tengunoibacter tsumagoiensis]GCE15751.1 hypothetical protein KTT_56100 [Tengunoibacter tsumagoiensis]